MKFTLSWLKDHLETRAPLEEILTALTDLGLEVEGVEDPAGSLGGFTVCRVIEAVAHPNADKLRLCRVETWPNGPQAPSEEVQVVCGAPNARTGLVGVFAAPGLHMPGTGVDLKPGVIRGVESNGMLCSERELTARAPPPRGKVTEAVCSPLKVAVSVNTPSTCVSTIR